GTPPRGPGARPLPAVGASAAQAAVVGLPFDAAALDGTEAAGDLAGLVGGADQARLVAQGGGDDPGLGAEAAAGERAFEGLPGRADEQIARRGDAAADDEAAGVQGRREVGDPDAQPVADLLEQLDRDRVALLGGQGDQR